MWWFAGSGIAGERVSCGLQGQLQSIQSVQCLRAVLRLLWLLAGWLHWLGADRALVDVSPSAAAVAYH